MVFYSGFIFHFLLTDDGENLFIYFLANCLYSLVKNIEYRILWFNLWHFLKVFSLVLVEHVQQQLSKK